eukprot:2109414-Rhodomonas_salina.3
MPSPIRVCSLLLLPFGAGCWGPFLSDGAESFVAVPSTIHLPPPPAPPAIHLSAPSPWLCLSVFIASSEAGRFGAAWGSPANAWANA